MSTIAFLHLAPIDQNDMGQWLSRNLHLSRLTLSESTFDAT